MTKPAKSPICAPTEDSDQSGLGIRPIWSESLLCTQWIAKDQRFLHEDREDWSDWVEAQADQSSLGARDLFGFVLLLSFQKMKLKIWIVKKLYISSEIHIFNNFFTTWDEIKAIVITNIWIFFYIQISKH